MSGSVKSNSASIKPSRSNASAASRVSAASQRTKTNYNAPTLLSSVNSNITEFLEAKLMVDEYGYTDKTCRNCKDVLTLDEILAFCIPLDREGRSRIDLNKIDFDNL
jgi:hypothetical protein